MIPTATAEEHGIRSVINKEEAQKVMSVLFMKLQMLLEI